MHLSSTLHPWSFTQRRQQAQALVQAESSSTTSTHRQRRRRPTSPTLRIERGAQMAMAAGFVFLGVTLQEGLLLSTSLPLSVDLDARLLRLARVAALALPLLTLLAVPHVRTPGSRRQLRLRGVVFGGFSVGMALMPTVLVAAALVDVRFKYALCVPALATTLAVWATAWQARRGGAVVEAKLWASIGSSLTLGLGIGMFAFDGPLPVPDALAAYTAPLRVVLRHAHSIGVAAVMTMLVAARLCRRRGRAIGPSQE